MKYLILIFILFGCTQIERVNDDKVEFKSTTIESSEPVQVDIPVLKADENAPVVEQIEKSKEVNSRIKELEEEIEELEKRQQHITEVAKAAKKENGVVKSDDVVVLNPSSIDSINGEYHGVNNHGIKYKSTKGINKWEFRRYYFEGAESGNLGILYEIVKWDNKLDNTRWINFDFVLYKNGKRQYKEGFLYTGNISEKSFPSVRERERKKAIKRYDIEVVNKVK